MEIILDPRITELDSRATPVEELEFFPIDPQDFPKTLLVGKELNPEDKQKLKDFLLDNLDVYAWRHGDMIGIDPKVSCHHLNIDPKFITHQQKIRALNPKKYEAFKEGVQRLENNRFMREAIYPKWISNLVLVKKHNGK